jgi:hypothetical protein
MAYFDKLRMVFLMAQAGVGAPQGVLGALEEQVMDRAEEHVRRRLARLSGGSKRDEFGVLGDTARQALVQRRVARCFQLREAPEAECEGKGLVAGGHASILRCACRMGLLKAAHSQGTARVAATGGGRQEIREEGIVALL